MKSHFLKLFDYDRYANHLLLENIITAGYPGKAVQLMEHLLVAQRIWYNRCAGLPPVTGTLWNVNADPANISAQLVDDNHKAWVDYIGTRDDTSFNENIAYNNLRGESYINKLCDICTHVINHGTHHRAQIGQHLKLAGVENLPGTDFIAFVRL